MRVCFLAVMAAAMSVSGCGSGVKKPEEVIAVVTDGPPSADSSPQIQRVPGNVDSAKVSDERGNLTPSQYNAKRSAEQYLSMSGFSKAGLIEQLSSDAGEGYSIGDAKAAVDSLNVDWNENATKSARSYLEMSGFSCKGLIEQLSSSAGEKYTVVQATYGARAAGAC